MDHIPDGESLQLASSPEPLDGRTNQDTKITYFGRCLIDVCLKAKLQILNGRVDEDKGIGNCRLCQTGQVETEKHLLTECPEYELIRFQFVNSIDIPESVVDSNQLFLYLTSNTLGHTECNTLGQYVFRLLKHRQFLLDRPS